jgi:hypothetical protein
VAWYAFLVALALALAATAYAVVRGVTLWRQAKSTGNAFSVELARFEERAARTERLLAEADRSTRDLQAAQERLHVSHAQLQVLLRSLERAKHRARWLRYFLPLR